MTQLLEGFNPDLVADRNHDEDCYFCNASEESAAETNELVAHPEEDEDLDAGGEETLKFKNDSGKLGSALGGAPDPRQIKVWGTTKDVSCAAHHAIPGNASLKKSQLFQSNEYLWKDGQANGNIGYNINSAQNGIWLPGNYAVRPWSGKLEHVKREYALAAIDKWGCQFHDAHEEYSTEVEGVLNKLFEKLEDGETLWCPKKKNKPKPEERQNMYSLVARLHTVSGRMKRMLKLPLSNWRQNIFTSRFNQDYVDKA
jgi:hypothetical protein